MAELTQGTLLIRWQMNEQEAIAAAVFSELNYKHIQNELATVLEEKLKTAWDPANPELFVQQHEYLRGQVEILQYLLSLHDNAVNAAVTAMRESSDAAKPSPQD